MGAIAIFLQTLATLVVAKNGGQPNDVSKLLQYAFLGARAGAQGKQYLQHAVDVVTTLVKEDRALTDQELADLQASVEGKLAAVAGIKIDFGAPAAAAAPNPPEGSAFEFPLK